jgi:tRNA uridine 5-carboxymethylaminomethyl modification enzyme
MAFGGSDPLLVSRTEGYTGILIDDLTSKGADEPYRMFTSRAEFRLHLRIDNADERLTPLGRKAGLVSEERWSRFLRKQQQKVRLSELFRTTRLAPGRIPAVVVESEDRPTVEIWLKRPENSISALRSWIAGELGEDPDLSVLTTLETEIKYAGYIQQQERQIGRLREAEGRAIPNSFTYVGVPGLSREIQDKLQRVRPATLGQAGRIPGVTPAAVAILDVYLNLGRLSV